MPFTSDQIVNQKNRYLEIAKSCHTEDGPQPRFLEFKFQSVFFSPFKRNEESYGHTAMGCRGFPKVPETET